MNFKRSISLQRPLVLALLVGVVFSLTAMANPNSKSLGELLVAKEVTLNGAPASSGLTVLSGSRIKTTLGGRVTVNLSKLGRVTLGPDTEVILTFSEGAVGGELLSGWMVVSAPKGVRVSPSTIDGLVVADGAQSSLLTIDVTSGNTRVESSGGSILAGGKKEFVAAGEEVEFSRAAGSADPIITRRSLAASESGVANPSAAEALGMTSLLTSGVRGAIEGITLNHSQASTQIGARTLDRAFSQASSPTYMRISDVQPQAITCGDFNENCANCSIDPLLVKAKAGCAPIGFNVRFVNVRADSVVSVRPFFSNACFRITPSYPQQVAIPPGGSYPFLLDATNCPKNAGQLPQNSQIVIETNTCGTRNVQVEWAPSCIK
jgi:hypothetical protein